MKALKVIVKVLLWALVVVVIALLALPLWIGPVAKGVANAVAPRITGTNFHLGEFGFNPYSGQLHVGDLQVANPTNFSETNAVDLAALDVNVGMMSLFGGKKYIVESVDLDGLVVYADATASNLRQIASNATGKPVEAEDDGAEAAKGAEEAKAEQPKPEPEKKEEPAAEGQKGKGLQINRITLKNITIKYGYVPVKVPMTIELTDLGKDAEEGMSVEEVGKTVYDKVMSAAGAVGGKLSELGKGAIDAVSNVDIEGAAGAVSDAAKGAADAVSDAAKGATDAVSDAAKSATDAVSGAAKGATDAVSGAAKGATDALKSAGDGLKDLFK